MTYMGPGGFGFDGFLLPPGRLNSEENIEPEDEDEPEEPLEELDELPEDLEELPEDLDEEP